MYITKRALTGFLSRSPSTRHFFSTLYFRKTSPSFYISNLQNASTLPIQFNRQFSINKDPKKEEVLEAEEILEDEVTQENEAPKKVEEPMKEVVTGTEQTHEFQAQTKKILNIVAKSLYTDTEIFLRELISNASDALEKLRHLSLTEKNITDSDLPNEIHISVNNDKNILIIQDFGIGMTKEDLVNNLGTIARSGSEEFVKNLSGDSKASDIIGQFGVGFYSCFMVADKVEVYTRNAKPDSRGYYWTSQGDGAYSIAEAEGVSRGTKIILHLKDDCSEFSESSKIDTIVKKYSNFVNYDIKLDGKTVNTIKALWTLPKNKVTDKEHKDFYQFISHAFDDPLYTIHYSTDSPIAFTALLYFPSRHTEKFGMSKMENGTSIYSRKVLIQSKAKGILPDWLRFIKGVIDSPEIPLNLSREHLQDSRLIRRINSTVTRKIIKFLSEESTNDREKFLKFYNEFSNFLKEGICTDIQWKSEIARLLHYDSSKMETNQTTTLDEYVDRMKPDQKEIFYHCISNRNFAENSPYFEEYKEKDLEVLFLYSPIDEFVMSSLEEYKGKKVHSIEMSKTTKKEETPQEKAEFMNWLKTALKDRASSIRVSNRLVNSPAIIVDHDSASMRRLLQLADPTKTGALPPQTLEVNLNHPVMVSLDNARSKNSSIANEVANQIMDNALIAAGLLDDARVILPRLNRILEAALHDH